MSHRSILVVDDDAMTRETICEVLADQGWQVSDEPCGLAALDHLLSKPSDLVVSDVDMPDITGFELLRRMHQAHITSHMVLMSARADEQLSRAASDAGAAKLFAKPVNIPPFTSFIAGLLA